MKHLIPVAFPVHFSVEEWTAIVRLVEENLDSLADWDDESQEFWQILLYKLQEGARG